MAQLTDLEKVRRRRMWGKRIRSLLLLCVFVAVVFAVSMVVYHKGEMDLKTAVSDITAEISTGTGYPAPLPGGKLLTMKAADSTLVIVADGNLYTYNATGRKQLDVQHGMVNPTVSCAGGRILAYDRGAGKVMLFSRSGQLQQLSCDFPVYDGDIAKNGNFALSSGSDKYLSQVVVYNGEGSEFYRCFFGDRPVVAVSLADGKDSMAVGLVNVSGGDYLSSIQRYQFSAKDPTAKLELPGELLLSLNFEDGDNVWAITDQRVAVFNANLKEIASFPYGEQQLLRFWFGDGGKLLLHLRDATGERRGRVVLLDERLDAICSIRADGELEKMAFDGNAIYLSDKSEIFLYDFTGRETARFSVGGLGLMEPMGGLLYYTTSSELCAKDTKDILKEFGGQGIASSQASSGASSGSSSGAGEAQTPPASSQTDAWAIMKDALLGTSEADTPESAPEETASSQASEAPPAAESSSGPEPSSAPESSAGEEGSLLEGSASSSPAPENQADAPESAPEEPAA